MLMHRLLCSSVLTSGRLIGDVKVPSDEQVFLAARSQIVT